MHSVKESYEESRVPDGRPYYCLKANMQEVTVVYLNRFVKELLAYISVLFHLCPLAPADTPTPNNNCVAPLPESLPHSTPLQQELATAGSAMDREKLTTVLELLGVPILLDVEMQAPVLVMPRHSTSDDSLQLDLGILRLTNSVAIMPNAQQAVDLMDVQLQQVCRRCHGCF
jgi:hypothetical protein